MRPSFPRVAVRAIILNQNRLLLVNAYPDGQSDLLCAPGGGVDAGSSLPDNLKREVFEETGLHVAVGSPCLVNEFHDPDGTLDRKSTRLNSSHPSRTRMPSSACTKKKKKNNI